MISTVMFSVLFQFCLPLIDKQPSYFKKCALNASIETRQYEFYLPLDYRKIPYRTYCEFASCKYNKCNTVNPFPTCKDFNK